MVWDIFDEMERMREDMERNFNRFFKGTDRPLLTGTGEENLPQQMYRRPVTDLREEDNKIIAEMEVPGIPKDKLEVNITNDEIEVKGEQESEVKDEDNEEGYYRYERRCNSFYRRIPLPAEVDSDKAMASYKDGILKVEVPKTKQVEEKKKRLQIK